MSPTEPPRPLPRRSTGPAPPAAGLDAQRFPHLAEYVARLPAGAHSYPEVVIRADGLEPTLVRLREVLQPQDAPEPLASYLRQSPTGWIPEVALNTAYLASRDLLHTSDQSVLDIAYTRSLELFRRPLYRALMFVLSPSLLVMGAGRRWNAFRRGVELSTGPVRRDGARFAVSGTLTFPPFLFNDLLIRIVHQALLAALTAASAHDARLDAVRLAERECRTEMSWGDAP